MEHNLKQQVWDIASDPKAPEEKWMAAVTLLNEKHGLVRTSRRTPSWLAFTWSVIVTGASASGAVLLFSGVQLILCTKISEIVGTVAMASNVAIAFGVWFVPCLVFSMLFTYKRLLFGGGKPWLYTQWGLVFGYIAAISFWAVDGQAVQPWDGGLLVIWNMASASIALLGTKMAEISYQSLNQTIGAEKVIIPMIRCFALIPVVIATLVAVGITSGFYLSYTDIFLFLTGLVAVSSLALVLKFDAAKSSTARTLATVLWSPFILSNLMLFPVMIATTTWLAFTGPTFITWVDYAGAVCALALSVATPLSGAWIASKYLQSRKAIALSRGDAIRSVAVHDEAQSVLLDADHEMPSAQS